MAKKLAKKFGTSSSSPSSSIYRRVGRVVLQGEEEHNNCSSTSVPKGFVPIMVGPVEATSVERVLVRVNKFKDPRVAGLLQMAQDELGCQPQGVLRLTCDADYFRRLIGANS